jgi:ammonia channel protein AmtB
MIDGLVYGGPAVGGMDIAWRRLACNAVGCAAIVGWTAVTCFVLFFTLKKLRMLRVSREVELKGE